MAVYDSVRTLAQANSSQGMIDWAAVSGAATEAVSPGELPRDSANMENFKRDITDAATHISRTIDADFSLPSVIELQNRHHWIASNIDMFEAMITQFDIPDVSVSNVPVVINSASMAAALSMLSSNVLGQYDPRILSDTPDTHRLYFVVPNIEQVASELDAEFDRFRRWIVFHEVTHAAEFNIAPWLQSHLETQLTTAMQSLSEGHVDQTPLTEVNTTMTVIEGFAEMIMDRAFDQQFADLRRKVDQRRGSRSAVTTLLRRFLGIGMKRDQYERGAAFFDTIAKREGVRATKAVWEDPASLPTQAELADPQIWIDRVV
ncbi:MAG: hypothetical protein J07HQX50_02379 [Haloquadratum sp. J07HQX50]|jgi:conserved hypothetical protein|nr:MAG: hypothetical protein J07HQX50_02379 [Haloquadratum sp. J07HQX50]